MIRIQHLTKRFGERIITNDLSLDIPEGKMTVIIGRSGEGKSLLLKQIIGLIKPTSGSIIIDGIETTNCTPQEQQTVLQTCGYVFQFAALLDSLSVFENIAITLLQNGYSREQAREMVKEKLTCVQLNEDILDKYPSELSGGMAKRVGLARTLMNNPRIMLYDEPTTGLDPITQRHIHELMHSLQKQFNTTSVVISHSTDLFQFADHVAFLYEGRIAYTGPAQGIWECDNPYIYQFIRGNTHGPIQAV